MFINTPYIFQQRTKLLETITNLLIYSLYTFTQDILHISVHKYTIEVTCKDVKAIVITNIHELWTIPHNIKEDMVKSTIGKNNDILNVI